METKRREVAANLTAGDVVEIKIGRFATVSSVIRRTHPRLRMPIRVTWDEGGKLWEQDYPAGCLFMVHTERP